MIHNIVFIIAREKASFLFDAEEDAAVNTLLFYLEQAGITDIVSFPENNGDKYIADVLPAFDRFIAKNKARLYCVSCWTGTYSLARDFVAAVRANDPDGIVVAGGPHFHSEDEIRSALDEGFADIIFCGGGEPFLNFAKSFFIDKSVNINKKNGYLDYKGTRPQKGCFFKAADGVTGQGRGGFPLPVPPLLELEDDSVSLRILLNDSCANHCDYCVIRRTSTAAGNIGFLKNQVSKAICQLRSSVDETIVLSLSDSAPFKIENRVKTAEFLRSLKKKSSVDSMSIFADPSDLDADFYGLAEEFNITKFFIGRDRVIEDAFIGRKFNGQLRSQSTIDSEKKKLEEFINFLENRQTKHGSEIYLGYILSPYETEEGSEALINDILDFSAQCAVLPAVRFQPNLFILNPYPGTAVAKKAAGDFIPLKHFYHPFPNAWISKSSENAYMEIVRHITAKLLCGCDDIFIHYAMLKLGHCIAYNARFDFGLFDGIENRDLRSFFTDVTDKILNMRVGQEKNLDGYMNNILSLYYFGCVLKIAVYRPGLLKYKNLYDIVKREDGAAFLIKRDIEMLRKLAIEGKVPYLENLI
ncbi:cobalamin B12-binding domain-containing protein [Seleniivibrio woodruffii]|uniref:cobalamin B12-binding domain-containing protein n=1 Tax=Seleniivibrio woodruffii TaxID=1078050 RepID=UPI0024099733|nr:cobalamin B12-binding domain-containing protein [Seleniivibrio woodruffii]